VTSAAGVSSSSSGKIDDAAFAPAEVPAFPSPEAFRKKNQSEPVAVAPASKRAFPLEDAEDFKHTAVAAKASPPPVSTSVHLISVWCVCTAALVQLMS
jgi:hypothetical protein